MGPRPCFENGLLVQAVDESLIVLKKGRSPSFDPNMPGLDLVGHDIVLSAGILGLRSWLLAVPIFHETVDVDGTPYTVEKFNSKLGSPEYATRLDMTTKYFQSKWCSWHGTSHLGSCMGTSCNIHSIGTSYLVTCETIVGLRSHGATLNHLRNHGLRVALHGLEKSVL